MRYYKELYWSESLEEKSKKKDKIRKKLEENRLQPDIYLIVLANNPKNHLEIFASMLLLQPSFPEQSLFVVGIAKGYDEALELVEEITKNVYNKTNGTDIRSYILSKEQDD